MDIALSLVGGVVLIGVIIAANGYFVAQEFAFMTVDRSRLQAQAEQGDRAAKRMLRVTGRTSFMLSGAQLGITMTGLLVGYVAEPLVGGAVGELLGGVGVPTATGIAIGTVGILVVSTFVQMRTFVRKHLLDDLDAFDEQGRADRLGPARATATDGKAEPPPYDTDAT